jgi:hypothetical protein
MWESDATAEYAKIKSAELALLSSDVRSDESRLSSLLSVDFVEIGRSGRRWSYPETLAALKAEERGDSPETSEWLFNRVSLGLVLVTYRIHEGDHDSRHASLWEIEGPVLRFHQGTIIPAA